MIKKIILGVLFVGLSGFLIFGAVNRTLAKTDDIRTEAAGGGRYQNEELSERELEDRGNPIQRNQQVNRSETDPAYGYGEGLQDGDRTGVPNPQATAGEWAEYEGTVISIESSMILVETDDGSEIVIEGRALVFLQDSGFVTNVGNTLFITGFYEDDEYKVATIIDQTTGGMIMVRDEGGRPGWAGNGWGGSGSTDH
ncbi:MAG: hypothetical protein Q7U53_08315 [Anaerolineaceae bacterium]|nr:hypothetical protein [Anaerolineaceae bacterium]